MNVEIKFDGEMTPVESMLMNEIGEQIQRDCDTEIEFEKKIQHGTKDGGLTIAISIASLGISAIGALINILQYISSKKPKYTVSAKYGNLDFTVNNPSQKEIAKLIQDMSNIENNLNIAISLDKNESND